MRFIPHGRPHMGHVQIVLVVGLVILRTVTAFICGIILVVICTCYLRVVVDVVNFGLIVIVYAVLLVIVMMALTSALASGVFGHINATI